MVPSIPCPLRFQRWLALPALLFAAGTLAAQTDMSPVDDLHEPAAEHADQRELLTLVQNGSYEEAYQLAFDLGEERFETNFNVLDGVGANVGDGQLFTRVPRADLTGTGQWAQHFPERATGPNAQACTACHATPF